MAHVVEFAVAQLPARRKCAVKRKFSDTSRKVKHQFVRTMGHSLTAHSSTPLNSKEKRVECPRCFEYVINLTLHQRRSCPAREVRCRFGGCNAVFPASDRKEHEQNWCVAIRHRSRLIRTTEKEKSRRVACVLGCGEMIVAREMAAHKYACIHRTVRCEDCGREMKYCDSMEHYDRFCPIKLKRDQLIRDLEKATAPVACKKCGEVVPSRKMNEHLELACECRLVKCRYAEGGICTARIPYNMREKHESEDCPHVKRRDRLARSFLARETAATCPLCAFQVPVGAFASPKKALEAHIRDMCPRRTITCPNVGCEDQMYPQDVGFHTLSRGEYPCFLCDRSDMAKPYIFRSRDPLQSVKIDTSKESVPANTYEQLTLLRDLLTKHGNLRKRIVRTFQRDYADIYALAEVSAMLDIENFRNMTDEMWEELIEDIARVAEDLKICSKAGGRGEVVEKILYVCSRCFEAGLCPPLTVAEQYDKLSVCRVAFRRQFLLHRKQKMDELIPCSANGCNEKVKRRHMKRHVDRECSRRVIKCQAPGCGVSFAFVDRAKHCRECSYQCRLDALAIIARDRFGVHECTFKCGFKGSAKEVDTHETTSCPKRTIQCSNEGCETYLPAEELSAHDLVCQARSATKVRKMELNSWSRTLTTHEDLLGYWKQKVNSRKRRVRILSDADDALETLCQELGSVGNF